MRIGHGYDVHRLVPQRKLILGGVEIPARRVGPKRPAGRSVLLPRGQPQGQLEEGAKSRAVEGPWRHRPRAVERIPGR